MRSGLFVPGLRKDQADLQNAAKKQRTLDTCQSIPSNALQSGPPSFHGPICHPSRASKRSTSVEQVNRRARSLVHGVQGRQMKIRLLTANACLSSGATTQRKAFSVRGPLMHPWVGIGERGELAKNGDESNISPLYTCCAGRCSRTGIMETFNRPL